MQAAVARRAEPPSGNGKPVVVGMAAFEAGRTAGSLVTYALGSCLGVAVWDPIARVGGLLHVMLPNSTIAPEKASANPFMFVDTGVPAMFRRCYELGAEKQRVVLKVAGGASPTTAGGNTDHFEIGKRNMILLRKLLWKNGVLIAAEEVGGSVSRTMSLSLHSGEVALKVEGRELTL